jgi:hypothetical protein
MKKANEDVAIRLLKSLLLRLYNMVYEINIRWWEMLIITIVGVLTGVGFGIMLGVIVKVKLP